MSKLIPCTCSLALTLFAVGACISEGAPSDDGQTDATGQSQAAIDGFIYDLGHLDLAEQISKQAVPCDESCPEPLQMEDSYCSYIKYTETTHFDRFVALQPNSATLWPGAVVRGADAEQGQLNPVGVTLAPVTFSVSLENIAGSPVGYMAEPSLSSFREERNWILSRGVTGATPASLDFQMTQIHSASQLGHALGASVSWPGAGDIAGGFSFDTSEKQTKILVNYTQSYYTIDVDTQERPADFFGPNVTVDDLSSFIAAGNPPLYVQSITYGRRVIFTVESSESAQAVQAALSATYSAANASGEVGAEHKDTLANSRITAFVLGGSGGDAAGLIEGYGGLVEYIKSGGDYSPDSPGAPIAYKLSYLDNIVTHFAFTTDYAQAECEKNRVTLRAQLDMLDHVGGGDLGNEVEFYGFVAIRAPVGGKDVVSCDQGGEALAIWYLDQGQWVSFEEYSNYVPQSPIYITVEDVAVGPGQQLCLFSHIFESDSGEWSADDDYGSDARMLSFEEGWGGNWVLQSQGAGESAVDAHVTIELLD